MLLLMILDLLLMNYIISMGDFMDTWNLFDRKDWLAIFWACFMIVLLLLFTLISKIVILVFMSFIIFILLISGYMAFFKKRDDVEHETFINSVKDGLFGGKK